MSSEINKKLKEKEGKVIDQRKSKVSSRHNI